MCTLLVLDFKNQELERNPYPDWEKCCRAIMDMDGRNPWFVSLCDIDSEESPTLNIMGGYQGRYNMHVLRPGYWPVFSINLCELEPEPEVAVAPDMGEFCNSINIVDLETVIRAASFFFKTGEPDPDLAWS